MKNELTLKTLSKEEWEMVRSSVCMVENRLGYRTWKRIFDVVLSSCSLLILFPLFALISLLVFVDDPHGSPFFSQIRVGRDGKHFRVWKFRSMVVDAEERKKSLKSKNEMEGHAFKMKNDPRITRMGRILRAYSLDELPQLWNILRGEMSFVGPRPPLPDEVCLYSDVERMRLLAVPGLTCLWQIQPNRNDISFARWCRMDIRYLYERTLWMDAILILKTVGVVLQHRGI